MTNISNFCYLVDLIKKKNKAPSQAPAIQVQSPHVYRSMMDGGIQLTDPTFLSLRIQLTGSGSETLGMW